MASTAVAVQKQQSQSLEKAFNQRKTAIASILPRHMDADRVTRLVLTAAVKNPKLYDCNAASILLATLNAAALGVEVDGYHAHLVPYGKTAQLIIDYKGWIDLVYRSGQIEGISAHVVREGDHFLYLQGTEERIEHRPDLGLVKDDPKQDEAQYTHAYAIGWLKDAKRPIAAVMPRAAVLRRKGVSKTANSAGSPWQLWPEEMWKKTAIRSLVKMLPTSTELMNAYRLENQADTGMRQEALKQDFTAIAGVEDEDEQEATSMRQQLESRFDDEPEDVPFTVPADEPSGMTPYEKWKAALDDCQTQTQANECLKDGLEWADGEMAQRMKNAADIRKGEIRNSLGGGSQKSFTE